MYLRYKYNNRKSNGVPEKVDNVREIGACL